MKNIIILLFISQTLLGQKHDYNWITGYGYDGKVEDEYGISQTSFDNENIKCIYVKSFLPMDESSTSISDKDGNLLFYTNGIDIYNKLHKPMKNSENFNFSTFNDGWKKVGLPLPQGIIALPDPTNSNKYYLLYPKIRFDKAKKVPYTSSINYATIDMQGDQNNGEVLLKDVVILNDTLNYNGITACKHGNGRDWWIIAPKFESNEYYRILLSKQGLKVLPTQIIGDTMRSSLSQVCFSLDGKKYARNSLKYTYEPAEFDIYDFDRCKGLLSNHKRIYYPTENRFAVGLSFSTNNKFAYTISRNKAIQWDLTAKDISKSGDTIAYYDGYIEDDIKVLQANFFMSQIAPDGKIYINSSNGTKHFHVIHKPNKKGTACQMQQHAFRLKTWNGGTLPNYPNYRLGPLDGSPCDTLGIDNIPVALFRYDKDTLNTFLVEFTDLSHHEPAKWEWDFGDGSPKSTIQEPVHTFKSKGEYQVCLTVSNANGKHTACKKIGVGVTVGTEDIIKGSIEIYPNPAYDYLTIDKGNNTSNTILIYSFEGKLIEKEALNNRINIIDVSHLQNGIYFCRLSEEDGQVMSLKFVIVH